MGKYNNLHSRNILRFLISAILLLTISMCLYAQEDNNDSESSLGPPSQIAGELELEKQIAERLESMLQPLVGPVVVLVDFSLTSTPVQLEGFTFSQKQSLPALPVSISEGVRELEEAGWDFNRITGISIRVFVSQDMSESEVDRITELIPLWINLNYARGDQVIVEPVPFVNPPISLVDFIYSTKGLIVLGGILGGFALLLALFLALFTGGRKGGEAKVTAGEGEGIEGKISGPISPQGYAQAMMPNIQLGDENNEIKASVKETSANLAEMFSEGPISVRLIREKDNRRALGSLSKLETMTSDAIFGIIESGSAELIAFALQLCRSNTVAPVLNKFDDDKRLAILEAWSEVAYFDAEKFEFLIRQLREKLDKVGGISSFLPETDSQLSEVINGAHEGLAKEIFAQLKQANPSLAASVRKNVFFLNDFSILDPKDLKRVVVNVPRTDLAALIKEGSDEIKDLIYSNLSERAANMLREEEAIVGEVNSETLKNAKTSIIKSMRRVLGTV